jgi:hypothetical protein
MKRQISRKRSSLASRFSLPETLEERRLMSTVAALTADSRLFVVDNSNPLAVSSAIGITGLQTGESLVGIDVRPATGELYGLSGAGRLYTVDAMTGVATLVAPLTAAAGDLTSPFTALAGTDFGIDFNPAVDALRIVSNANENLRVNPDTGAVTTDTPLAYDAGDQSAGAEPDVVDIAYTPIDAGTSTLLGIEGLGTNLHNLKLLPDGVSTVPALSVVRIGGIGGNPSPANGLLFTNGPFGRDGVFNRGMDIAEDGTTFVGVELHFESGSGVAYELVKINPDSGVDTSQGFIGDGQTPIVDIAIVPSLQFSSDVFAVNETDGTATITVTRTGATTGTTTVDFTTRNGTAAAGVDYGTATGTLTFAPGDTSKTFTVPIVNDSGAEDDETVTLFLGSPTGNAFLGKDNLAFLRINASDQTDTTPPKITSVLETGPSRSISGFVVRFNEDMDEASAENVANYTFRAKAKKTTTVPFSTAVYDAAKRLVTVAFATPIMQTDFKSLELRVASGGLVDTSGNALDGNGNGRGGDTAVFKFKVITGTTIKFKDADGDSATINLGGAGRIDSIFDTKTHRFQAWILDPIALRTTLSGTVKKGTRGDGIVVIAEIIGLDKKEFTPLLSNTSFRVNTLTFSSNATGIG